MWRTIRTGSERSVKVLGKGIFGTEFVQIPIIVLDNNEKVYVNEPLLNYWRWIVIKLWADLHFSCTPQRVMETSG